MSVSVRAILETALDALVTRGWIKNQEQAWGRHCAVGAVRWAIRQHTGKKRVYMNDPLLEAALCQLASPIRGKARDTLEAAGKITSFNDENHRTWGDVEDLFKKAIVDSPLEGGGE